MSGLEVIGGAAAVLQLIINVAQLNSRFKNLLKKARYQSEFLEKISIQVTSIITSADTVLSASCQASAEVSIARLCADKAIALRALLTKWHSEATKNHKLSIGRRYMIAIAWTVREKKIEELWKDINDYMDLLKFHASCKTIANKVEMIGPSESITPPSGACGANSKYLPVS